MTLKHVGELQGAALNWAVAKAIGITDDRIVLQRRVQLPGERVVRYPASVSVRWLSRSETPPTVWEFCAQRYEPSTNWGVGGPISEGAKIWGRYISADDPSQSRWEAISGWFPRIIQCIGPTELIAKMRCFVSMKLGDAIDIPDELDEPASPIAEDTAYA